jgi:hypothetical protein
MYPQAVLPVMAAGGTGERLLCMSTNIIDQAPVLVCFLPRSCGLEITPVGGAMVCINNTHQ